MSIEIADLTMSSPYTGATPDRCIRLNSGGWKRKMNTGSTRHEIASWTASGTDRTVITATDHGAAVGDVILVGYTTQFNLRPNLYGYGVVTHVDSSTQIRFQSSYSLTDSASSNGEYLVVQKWKSIRYGWRFCTPSSLSSFNPPEVLFFGLSTGDNPFTSPSLVRAVGFDLGNTGYPTWTRITDGTNGDYYATTSGSNNKAYIHAKVGSTSNATWTTYYTSSWYLPAANTSACALIVELDINTSTGVITYKFNLSKYSVNRGFDSGKFEDVLKLSDFIASSDVSTEFSTLSQAPTGSTTYAPEAQEGIMETMEVSWPRTDPPLEILDYGWNIIARQ